MTDKECNEESHQKSDSARQPVSAQPSPGDAASEAAKVKKLTPEEQMALYEKELKENDWGHQPC